MSTTQILHPEAKSATVSSHRLAMMASPDSSFPTTPAQEVTVEFPSDFAGPSPAPRAGQTVFERIPSAKVTQSRRVLLTTLLILANLVQVSALMNSSGRFLKTKTLTGLLDDSEFCWYCWRQNFDPVDGCQADLCFLGWGKLWVSIQLLRNCLYNLYCFDTHIEQVDTRDLRSDQRSAGRCLRIQGDGPCWRCMAFHHNPGKCLLWQGLLCLSHYASPRWTRRSFHHAKCCRYDFEH